MTTVSAIQGLGYAVIGSDSRTTDEGKIYELPSDISKIVSVGKYLIGITGMLKTIPALAYQFTPSPAPATAKGAALDKFITKTFIPELEAFLSKNFPEAVAPKDREKNKTEDDVTEPFAFLVVVNSVVYEIDSDFTWIRDQRGVYGVGSGSDYAIGSLLTNLVSAPSSIEEDERRVRISLEVASRMDKDTGGDIHIYMQTAARKK